MATPHEERPETIVEHGSSINELLRLHDEDPYGYIGQAIAFLDRSGEWHGKPDYVLPIAVFASETGDAKLMQQCMAELGEKQKWRLFADEIREGRFTISLQNVQDMGEHLALLEAKPERSRDYKLLADIYASRLEISLHTGGDGLDEQLTRLHTILTGVTGIPIGIGRRVVSSLLAAGLEEKAKPFLQFLLGDDHLFREQQVLATFQRLQSKGKPLPEIQDYRDERFEVLRKFDSVAYVAQRDRMGDLRAGINATSSKDLLTLLQAGQVPRAQKLFEGLLEYTFEFDPERLQMELWMAQYSSEYEAAALDDAQTAIEGCRKLARLIESGATVDVTAEITARQALEPQMQQACALVDRLPFSSNRIALALELSAMQRSILPKATALNTACATLITGAWNVIVKTMTSHYTEDVDQHPLAVRVLWGELKEAGFNLYLKGTPEARAIDQAEYEREHWLEIALEKLDRSQGPES